MIMLLTVLLIAQGDPAKKEKPKPLEANARPCFAGDQVTGREYNAFWLDVENKSEEDLNLLILFEGNCRLQQSTILAKSGGKKRLFAYVPTGRYASTSADVRVRIVNQKTGMELYNNVVQAGTIGDPSKDVYVLALTRPDMSLSDLSLPSVVASGPVKVASCEPKNFPDNWIGLRGIDVCVVYSYEFANLDPAPQRALADWVYAGGHLIIVPTHDPGWLKSSPLDELLPFKVTGPDMIKDHQELNKLFGMGPVDDAYAFYALRGPENLKYPDPKGPLAGWQSLGKGTVCVLAFDIVAPPFKSHGKVRERFFSDLINEFSTGAGDLNLGRLKAVNRIVVPPPPIGMVLILIIAFVLIVGPFNYIVLFQRRRPIFSVITIPAISLAFAVLVLVLGLVLRSGHRLANNVVLLQTQSDDAAAYELRLVSLLSPGSQAYDFEFQNQTYLYTGPGSNEELFDKDTVEKLADGMALRGIRLQRFESKQIHGHGVRRLGAGISVRRENTTLTLKNNSNVPLHRGIYCFNGRYHEIDDLKPGVERKIELAASNLIERPYAYLGGADPASLEAAQALLSVPEADVLYILLDQDLGKVNIAGLAGAGTRDFVVLKVRAKP